MPYAIIKSLDAQLRTQLTRAVNMATVQTVIGLNHFLTVPSDCQSSMYGTQTVIGTLEIDGEFVISDYP